MQREVLKLAKLVETRDLNEREFKDLIDTASKESMNLQLLKESLKSVNNEQF